MDKLNKKQISARLNYYNYELVRTLADTVFEGDFSKALDWILYSFRENTHFKKMMELVRRKGEYDRGVRTQEVLDAVRQLEYVIKFMTETMSG